MTKTEILRHTEQDDRTRAQENDFEKLLISSNGKNRVFSSFCTKASGIPSNTRLF